MAKIDPEIQQLVDATAVIDTHEHLCDESHRIGREADVSWCFSGYVISDMIVAGLPPEDAQRFASPEASPRQKWKLIEPYWPLVQQTGYGRATMLSVSGLFGIDELSAETMEQLDEQVKSSNRPGRLRHILQELCNIELCHINVTDDDYTVWRPSEHGFFKVDLSTAGFTAEELPLQQYRRTV